MLNLELLIIAKYLTVLCSELKPESVFFRGQRDLGVGLSWKPVDSSVNWFMAVVIFVNCGFCFLVTNSMQHTKRDTIISMITDASERALTARSIWKKFLLVNLLTGNALIH